ncbi:unnamed protein product (macronuclear) [Paramecium tetraurelia]|uniref:Uncharacterized protein n=1 Tax=Paramecium tetraurelia TaxID=5888 RepID=A0CJS2_PARTE|nr:uncharacterized protein GSPATT00000751001 [Paramecium tetraurelia]CAK71039.1 unnamed protein product [Paramecium tetraurelia]|eukprot:XP_001438436.1 hypothetical protein (macronuclear) [Paramecium tetraurelia strain d4-2]
MNQPRSKSLRVDTSSEQSYLNKEMVTKLQSLNPSSFVTYEVLDLFFTQLQSVLREIQVKQQDFEKIFSYFKTFNEFENKLNDLEQVVNRIAQVVIPLQEELIEKVQKSQIQQQALDKYFSTFPQQLDLILNDRFNFLENQSNHLAKQSKSIKEDLDEIQNHIKKQDNDMLILLKSYKELLSIDPQYKSLKQQLNSISEGLNDIKQQFFL